jgi:exportin-2 (importin alpha re-exporter)
VAHHFSQLTREQLLSVLPLLVRHLNSDNYVTYTYAAITIDRILFIKKGTQLLYVRIKVALILRSRSDSRFSQTDIHDLAADLLDALLSKIEAAGPPEKVAENDHLMKCKSATYPSLFAGADSRLQVRCA